MPVWTMCKINILLFSLIDEPVIAWGEKKKTKEKRGRGDLFLALHHFQHGSAVRLSVRSHIFSKCSEQVVLHYIILHLHCVVNLQ